MTSGLDPFIILRHNVVVYIILTLYSTFSHQGIAFQKKRTIDLASNLFSLLFLSVFLFIYSLIFPNFDYTRKYDRPDRNASHPRPNGGERPGRARPWTYEGKAHRGEQVYPTCVQPVQKSVRVLSLTHERFMLTSEINGIGRQNAKANLYATDV